MSINAHLDTQSKAVAFSLHQIGYKSIENLRIGKHIVLEIEAENKKSAKEKIEQVCKNILSKPGLENYSFMLVEP